MGRLIQLRRQFSLDWALTAGAVSTTMFGSRNPACSPGSASRENVPKRQSHRNQLEGHVPATAARSTAQQRK